MHFRSKITCRRLKKCYELRADPLEQTVNRISELSIVTRSETTSRTKRFKIIGEASFSIRPKKGENCCLAKNGAIVIITEPLEQGTFRYRTFHNIKNFYIEPIQSSILSIFLVDNLTDDEKVGDISMLMTKVYLVPYKGCKFVAVPLL